MQRYAIVVDPLAAGQDYPAAFAEAGVETVAVLASPDTLSDPYYQDSWHPENFRRRASDDHQAGDGTNHLIRTVAHRVRGEVQDGYRLAQYVCSVVVNAPHAGIWRNAEIFANVGSLASYHLDKFYYRSGDMVPAPAGFASFLGWVGLASADRGTIEADYRSIKDLERQIQVEPGG